MDLRPSSRRPNTSHEGLQIKRCHEVDPRSNVLDQLLATSRFGAHTRKTSIRILAGSCKEGKECIPIHQVHLIDDILLFLIIILHDANPVNPKVSLANVAYEIHSVRDGGRRACKYSIEASWWSQLSDVGSKSSKRLGRIAISPHITESPISTGRWKSCETSLFDVNDSHIRFYLLVPIVEGVFAGILVSLLAFSHPVFDLRVIESVWRDASPCEDTRSLVRLDWQKLHGWSFEFITRNAISQQHLKYSVIGGLMMVDIAMHLYSDFTFDVWEFGLCWIGCLDILLNQAA